MKQYIVIQSITDYKIKKGTLLTREQFMKIPYFQYYRKNHIKLLDTPCI